MKCDLQHFVIGPFLYWLQGFMKKTQLKSTSIHKRFWLYTTLIVSCLCGNLYAEESTDKFQFELTPYLWAASIKGSTSVDGGDSPPIDSDYSFFALDNLDGVASATFTGQKNQWGFLFDFLYVSFEDTFKDETLLEVTAGLEGVILEFAGTYVPKSIGNVEFIAGLRQQDITVSLEFESFGGEKEGALTWVDPFFGAIYSYPFNEKFHIALRGDIGGFGIESDMAVNAEVLFRYQMSEAASIKFGYRYLKVKFDDKDFLYDISLDGLHFGMGFSF